MRIVKVTYTTTAEFSEQNQQNIKHVMLDLRKLNRPGINYHACLAADNKTFIHTAFMEAEEDHQVLNELASFKTFQQELKAGGLEVPPKQEFLTLVGSTKDIF